MVGRFIHDQSIGAGQHHARQHAAYFLAAGQYTGLFRGFFAGKEHSAQETTGKGLSFGWR